jgi:hypothetical protein
MSGHDENRQSETRSGRDRASPARPWVVRQEWRDVLFAHWAVNPSALRRLLPHGLAVDTYHGAAYVGVIPFRIPSFRLRWLPPVPGLDAFDELNVRTYVTTPLGPGVFFFSLDATSRLAVKAARRFYHLRYHEAAITIAREGDWIHYRSVRKGEMAAAMMDVRYRGIGEASEAATGTLERWLVERYRLYTVGPAGRLRRAEIDHAPWRLRQAEGTFKTNTMASAMGIGLPSTRPVLHFADASGPVYTWPLAQTIPAAMPRTQR